MLSVQNAPVWEPGHTRDRHTFSSASDLSSRLGPSQLGSCAPFHVSPGWRYFCYPKGYICYQDTYPMYRACIVHVFRMYLDVSRSSRYIKIHQDTSRYIKIHQDTFVQSFTLAIIGNVSYLGICILLDDTFRIHSRYIQDTFKIQCILTLRYMTHKIHSRYMSDA